MSIVDYTIKLLGLSEVIHKWYGSIRGLDTEKREKIARYCETIADTLDRTAVAFDKLSANAANKTAARDARRELGRMTGYVEDIAAALEDHLDGRKIAGVKRRLEALIDKRRIDQAIAQADDARAARLVEAEGYFRSVAGRLRA